MREKLVQALDRHLAARHGNPLENPVKRLAQDIVGWIDDGALDPPAIADLIQELSASAFDYRARRLAAHLGEGDIEANAAALRALVIRLTHAEDGALVPFEVFKGRVEREILGIVVTAHPTFSMSQELSVALARLATGHGEDGRPLRAADRAALLKMARRVRHGPPEGLDLGGELVLAAEAIGHVQGALRRVYGVVLEVAAEAYPARWSELRPRLVTVASWVGFDVDGRADIAWTDTLRAGLTNEARQLERYLAAVRALAARCATGAEKEPASPLKQAESRLHAMAQMLAKDLQRLDDLAGDDDAAPRFNRHLAASRQSRLVDAGEIIELLDRADADRQELALLGAEMANYGLGMAHIHMRLNASQLINAIRKQVGLESSPDSSGQRRGYLRAINALLDEVRPVSINFGSILAERMSARRMFMLIAQFLKYVDAATPIRLLIAECETPFTVLTALYFARLFGVDDKVDISPLFETPAALQIGHEIVGELLQSPHYRAYVHARGRLCLQTGFSDAGRYIGQVAAALAIERLRVKVADEIAAADLSDVELVIFDTHGESIGRGAHPVDFRRRLDYIDTPASRARFAAAGIPVKLELSFQGGDGYVYFATPEIAFATLCRLLEHALSAPAPATDDLFYRDTDYSLEFFLTIKEFNDRVIEDPDYAALLGAFGTNIVGATGSRKSLRQHEATATVDHGHPTQIRAIPHNAILQQLGYLANSVGGVGRAIARDRDHFLEVMAGSARCRLLISLAAVACRLSCLDAFAAYVALFNPVAWLLRAAEAEPERAEQMKRLARLLDEAGRHEKLNRILRRFLQDEIEFRATLDALEGDDLVPPWVAEAHPDLELLHAIRLALIEEIFQLVTRIPRFSSLPDVTTDEVVAELLHLDVPRAVEALRRAFPVAGRALDDASFGEPATYRVEGEQGYETEERELFQPMLELHDLLCRTSAAITHLMGAVG